MKRGRYSDSVRIVHIDTHFVETEEENFRAVVQKFTGKNSSDVWAGNGLLSSSSSSSSLVAAAAAAESNNGIEGEAGRNYFNENEVADRFQHGGVVAAVKKPGDEAEIQHEEDEDYILSFMKANSVSFKDFEGLLSEFSLMEDLPLLEF